MASEDTRGARILSLFYLLIGLIGLGIVIYFNIHSLALIFVLALVPLLIITSLISNRIGLLTLIVVLMTMSWTALSQDGYWNHANVAYAMSWLIGFGFRGLFRGDPKSPDRISYWFTIIGVIALVSSVFTVWRYVAFQPIPGFGYLNLSVNVLGLGSDTVIADVIAQTLNYLAWGGTFLAAYQMADRKGFLVQFRQMILPVSVVNFVVAALQLSFTPALFTTYKWMRGRQATGLMEDSNALGISCAIILLTTPYWLPKGKLPGVKDWITIVSLVGCLVLAGSRTPVLMLVVFVIMVSLSHLTVLVTKKRFIHAVIILAIVSVVLLLLVYGLLQASTLLKDSSLPLVKRLVLSFEEVSRSFSIDTMTSNRFSNWSIATWVGISYPLSGLGPGTYFCEACNFARSKGLTHTLTDNATNLYLNVFAELGIIALVALMAVFILLLIGQVRRINRPGGPNHREVSKLCFLVALLVAFTVGPHVTLFVLMVLTMTFLGLTAADFDGNTKKIVRQGFEARVGFTLLVVIVLIVGVTSWLMSIEIAPERQWRQLRWSLHYGFFPKETAILPGPLVVKNQNAAQPDSFTMESDIQTGNIPSSWYCAVSMGWEVENEYSWAVWVHNNRLQFNSSPDGRTRLGIVAEDTEIESDRNYRIRIAYKSSNGKPRAEIWINELKQRTSGSIAKRLFKSRASFVIGGDSGLKTTFPGKIERLVIADGFQSCDQDEDSRLANVLKEYRFDKDAGDVPFVWMGTTAMMTLKPSKRYLHIHWRAGHKEANELVQHAEVYLGGKLLGTTDFREETWRHDFFPVSALSDKPEIMAIKTSPAFIPSKFIESEDSRSLGPALAWYSFCDRLPHQSYGFWPTESGALDFQWSTGEGYKRVKLGTQTIFFKVMANHPDIDEQPVKLTVDINRRWRKEIVLTDTVWQDVEISPDIWRGFAGMDGDGGSEEGFLHFIVSRTWIPSRYINSKDDRTLGVAVSKIHYSND